MKKFSSALCFFQATSAAVLFSLLMVLSLNTKAQSRNLGLAFSENLRGGTTIFGNTLMNAVDGLGNPNTTVMNGNSVNGNSIYDNGTQDMHFIDIDGNTGDGAGTSNSSSADLILPAGTNTIRLARLYWGGRVNTSQFDMSQAVNQRIKIRKGTSGAYQEYQAAQIDKKAVNVLSDTLFYQAFVDITELVKVQGAGTYTVGNGIFSTGVIDEYGFYGGWSIVVVYENPALDFNSVRLYEGFKEVYSNGGAAASSLTITGLNVPSGALSLTDARIGLMAWEGDARYIRDSVTINNIAYNDAFNQTNNFWNGTITTNGAHVTTKNPNYTDQMSVDIDQFDVGVGYGILPDATSVDLKFITYDDQYFIGIISFVIKMKDPPVIKLTKTVTDASNSNTAEAGEVLTYKLKGDNISLGNVNSVVLTDSLPGTMTFVPGSLKVNYGPGVTAGLKTDISGDDIAEYVAANKTVTFRLGTGANAATGGTLAAAESFEVEFNVTVNTPGSGVVPPIINTARLKAITDGLVDYVDDATAVISPQGGPLPVTLTSFTANLQQNNMVKVAWSTSMEMNSSRYDVERSSDGVIFSVVATKAASGNSSAQITYFINDDISAVTAPIVYYRLKQVDIDGKTSISKVVSVKLKKTVGKFTVSPNPFRNNVNINIEWDKNETTVVKVFNVAGTEVVAKNVKMIKGYNYIAIDELSLLQPGSYVIQFVSANGKLIKQVIKQK